jgi:hypothetical protein
MLTIDVPSCIFLVVHAAIVARMDASRSVVSPNHKPVKPFLSTVKAISGTRPERISPLPLSMTLTDNTLAVKEHQLR